MVYLKLTDSASLSRPKKASTSITRPFKGATDGIYLLVRLRAATAASSSFWAWSSANCFSTKSLASVSALVFFSSIALLCLSLCLVLLRHRILNGKKSNNKLTLHNAFSGSTSKKSLRLQGIAIASKSEASLIWRAAADPKSAEHPHLRQDFNPLGGGRVFEDVFIGHVSGWIVQQNQSSEDRFFTLLCL